MPAASSSRQPENALAWFDTMPGRGVLADELGLLMPLLVRCPGSRACHVLPTEQAVELAPPLLMSITTRLWCDGRGWHAADGKVQAFPAMPALSVDLVLAMHVIAMLPEPKARLETLHRMLVPGGMAFFAEFNPWGSPGRDWRNQGVTMMSVRRLSALAVECGFEIEASYALCPRTSDQSSGRLLRHGWRVPAWLPLCAYAIRARKRDPGMTLVGKPLAVGLAGASGA